MACLLLAFRPEEWGDDVGRYGVIEACANPECGKILHYLREGRIFAFSIAEREGDVGQATARVEHYWLCGRCCDRFTLRREGKVVCLVTRSSVFVSNGTDARAV